MKHIGRMWHCGVDVVYPRLSDWTCLQWTLHSWHTHLASPFSASGVAMRLFQSYFGISCYYEIVKKESKWVQQFAGCLTTSGTHMPYGITQCYLPVATWQRWYSHLYHSQT